MQVDYPDFKFMNTPLAILKKEATARADKRAFPLLHKEWSKQYVAAVAQLNLQNLGPMLLYQLRHGGASHELATNRRGLHSLAKRGR